MVLMQQRRLRQSRATTLRRALPLSFSDGNVTQLAALLNESNAAQKWSWNSLVGRISPRQTLLVFLCVSGFLGAGKLSAQKPDTKYKENSSTTALSLVVHKTTRSNIRQKNGLAEIQIVSREGIMDSSIQNLCNLDPLSVRCTPC